MSVLLRIIVLYPGVSIMLEALLIGFIIALIGAGGYTFFIFSMKDDRDDKMRERMAGPWEKLSGQNEPEIPKSSSHGKRKIVLLILMAVLLVFILLLLAIKFA